MSVVPTVVTLGSTVNTLTLAAGSTGGLAVASTIDPVNDYVPIYTASATATQGINRNTYLGLSNPPLGTLDSQTVGNKTLSNTNALTIKDTSLTVQNASSTTKQFQFLASGITAGQTRIYTVPDYNATMATLAGSETLTNKTLTSPTITSPTITNATLSSDSITGYTSSSTGTIYGVSVSAGTIASAALVGSVNSAALATGAVGPTAIATGAITLGYAQITGNVAITATSATLVTGLSVTVTIPAGGRKIKVTVFGTWDSSTAAAALVGTIWSGIVGDGTQLAEVGATTSGAGVPLPMLCIAVYTPSAGSVTYNYGLQTSSESDAANVLAGSTSPAFILVEAI